MRARQGSCRGEDERVCRLRTYRFNGDCPTGSLSPLWFVRSGYRSSEEAERESGKKQYWQRLRPEEEEEEAETEEEDEDEDTGEIEVVVRVENRTVVCVEWDESGGGGREKPSRRVEQEREKLFESRQSRGHHLLRSIEGSSAG